MDTDEAAILLEDIKKLGKHSTDLLMSQNIRPETLYPRKGYVYAQFIFSLALLDGIVTLAERGKTRSMVPLVRALWEGWVGVRFVYSGKSHVWAYYLQMQEELTNRKKRNKHYADGEIKDVKRYKERNKEASKIINLINRRYKELPLVPGVITAGKQSLVKRKITLKEKCQIIDYYDSLRPGYSSTATTLTKWYESAYGHMSGTVHVSVTELNGLFKYDAAGNLQVDISGGNDRGYMASLLLSAYLYHYLVMQAFISNVAKTKRRIPDDIKAAKRRMMAKKPNKP